MILNAHSNAKNGKNIKSKLNDNDIRKLIEELVFDPEFILNLLSFREENVDNKKMHALLTHICKQIYNLDQEQFLVVG